MTNNKIKYADTLVYDIEANLINRGKDNRFSETYSIIIKSISHDKLLLYNQGEITGDLSDTNFLYSFINKETIHLRTQEQLVKYLKSLKRFDGKNTRRLMYAHNLSFELSALLRETQGNSKLKKCKMKNEYGRSSHECIFREKSSPIMVILNEIDNIEFRCSYALTSKSIKELGEEFNYNKLDYDYTKIRRPFESLSKEDIKYNTVDVDISALAVVQQCLINKCMPYELPYTLTGSVKNMRKNFIIKEFGNEKYKHLILNRKDQLEVVDYNFYNFIEKIRQGGLTACNRNFINEVLTCMLSIDITSSYPYVMAFYKMPRFTKKSTKYYEGANATKILKYIYDKIPNMPSKIKGFVARVHFKNIELMDDTPFPCISVAKCLNSDKITRQLNGKVLFSKELIIDLNDYDFRQIMLSYKFEAFMCHFIYTTNEDKYLSLSEISFVLESFLNKQLYKNKDDKKVEYRLAKTSINSLYGIKTQLPIRGYCELIDGIVNYVEFNKVDDKLEAFKNHFENDKTIDVFTDGMYIPSIAKYRLIEMSIKIVKDTRQLLPENIKALPIYTDTDSIKIALLEIKKDGAGNTIYENLSNNSPLYINIISDYIKKINDKIVKNSKENKRLNEYINLFNKSEKDVKTILDLGTWDLENYKDEYDNYMPITYFCSLGSKKYCYVTKKYDKDNKIYKPVIVTKLAGCSTDITEAIKLYAKKENIPIENALRIIFNIGTKFDESCSGRTVCYPEKRSREEVKSLLYDNTPVSGYGLNMIENTSYTLGITPNDYLLLKLGLVEPEPVERILSADGTLTFVNNDDKNNKGE